MGTAGLDGVVGGPGLRGREGNPGVEQLVNRSTVQTKKSIDDPCKILHSGIECVSYTCIYIYATHTDST